MHALEVHQAELEQQNESLIAANAELARTNAALAVARDRYRALYELAPAPLVTLDARGTILDVNDAAEKILGARSAAVVGRPFAIFVAEASRASVRELIAALFAGRRLRGAALVLAPEGAPKADVLVDGVVFRDDAGATRAVLACADITAHRRTEEEARVRARRADEAQRLESLGVLAGGIAHDFNNLLTVVLGGADHVLGELDEGSPLVEPLVEVLQAARQAGALAHQMLAYSGRASMPPRPIDLVALIRELEPLLRASAKGTPLAMRLPDDVPTITGDDAQLRQVVLNLVINAAEAMHDRPGAIAIEVRADGSAGGGGRRVSLEVRDQGVGMDEATQARIFEPYFSTKFVGRGLGLAVVQGIVRGHRGTMTVASTPGRGTTFEVCFPAASGPPRHARGTAPPEAEWQATGTLLVVDDEPFVRVAIARILESFGFEVVAAADGVEAVDVIRADPARFDLVLMDLTMPRMGGVAAAQIIHEVRADLPLVLITGYGEIPAEAGSVFAGMLAKPFDVATIQHMIQRLLPMAVSA
ncbi:MAG TPA: ATP-binding protein [Kofleriaceae bacterium]|nr:ATP-binding protein [Kofleriaceae bacterium]